MNNPLNPTPTPTVGRRVWFYWHNRQTEPIDAGVIKVLGDGPEAPVHLDICDPDTGYHSVQRGIVVGDETTTVPHYRWMPYQLGKSDKKD